MRFPRWSLVLVATLLGPGRALALPFASEVVSYTPGADVTAGFDDPTHALGSPSRDTDFGNVTPFNSAFSADQLVSVGTGGSLVVRFDAPVFDDPANPFGFDLLVFGNAFFFDPSFEPIATDVFAEPGQISVSQDGLLWFDITTVFADGLFPTLGFLDTTGPFESDGALPTDFTLPVDPSIPWMGATFEELVPLYAGSGGGAGVDIAETGLPWIQYVRITQDTPGVTTEIDGFADVAALPEPGAAALLALALAGLAARRVRGRVDPSHGARSSAAASRALRRSSEPRIRSTHSPA